jgi:hypothetical protein
MNESENESGSTNPQTYRLLKFIAMLVVLVGEDCAEYKQLRLQIEEYVRPLEAA